MSELGRAIGLHIFALFPLALALAAGVLGRQRSRYWLKVYAAAMTYFASFYLFGGGELDGIVARVVRAAAGETAAKSLSIAVIAAWLCPAVVPIWAYERKRNRLEREDHAASPAASGTKSS